ncbi:LysR family transcriptional regulator [Massilia niastensis]|uniref:LysR family transcriptional regulator n=1 Tax=Massilia niastensis TaxID=544911 RepID=UPI000382C60E|nr:LysR family transcriptional regulator [Massilia niastensis]
MDQLAAIRAFARVVEAGSFTRAADSLDMPKATVTKLVQSLEAHLRVRLLQRTTRRVTVTPEGAEYYEKTGRLLAELEEIDGGFGVSQSRPRGRLRIDVGSSVANLLLLPALPEFLARYPEIRVDLGVSDRHVDLVGENVDCVIRGGPLSEQAMVGRQIGAAAWVTCAAPGYLERHGVPADPGELEREHRVVSYLSARTNRVLPMEFSKGKQHVALPGTRNVGVNESNAHIAAALAGLGVIQTFRYAARAHLEAGTLAPVLEDWTRQPYPFYIVYPPNRHLHNRLRVFIDWIAERFPALLS